MRVERKGGRESVNDKRGNLSNGRIDLCSCSSRDITHANWAALVKRRGAPESSAFDGFSGETFAMLGKRWMEGKRVRE